MYGRPDYVSKARRESDLIPGSGQHYIFTYSKSLFAAILILWISNVAALIFDSNYRVVDRSFPNSNSFTCLCAPLYADVLMYGSCRSTWFQNTICGCSVPFFEPPRSVFLRRSEPTFLGRPLSMWGPRPGHRGSNAGIVLHAQHAFSLLAARHATSTQSLIPRS